VADLAQDRVADGGVSGRQLGLGNSAADQGACGNETLICVRKERGCGQ
jgi:hypothetical protein